MARRRVRSVLAGAAGMLVAAGLNLGLPGVAAAAGILPPDNPAADVAIPDCPVEFGDTGPCVPAGVAGINVQHAAEGIPDLVLPSNWYSLTTPEQEFVVTDEERTDRGEAPYVGLVSCLSSDAQTAAVDATDPHYGGCLGIPTLIAGVWAGGDSNPLLADFGWMYDDGWSSSGLGINVDCLSATDAACWGHRDLILFPDYSYSGPCYEGAGYDAGDSAVGFNSYAQEFICLYDQPVPTMYFTWADDVEPYLGTPPVAPTFTMSAAPSPLSVAYDGTGTATVTLAASDGYDSPVTLSASGAPGAWFSTTAPAWSGGTASAVVHVPAGDADEDVTITATAEDGTVVTAPLAVDPDPTAGYWMVDAAGEVFPFGSAPSLGSTTGLGAAAGIASTPDRGGYWVAAPSGAVQAFGDATSYALSGAPSGPVVTIASTADGEGYWEATASGQVLTAGDAADYGSPAESGLDLNGPIVNMVPTADGKGYWLLGSDGGVFAYGDAAFYGSTGGVRLNEPAVAMTPTPDDKGYWFVASDGGIFTFGDAGFFGSMGGVTLNKPMNGMVATADGRGYWTVASDGGVFTFGDAGFVGSLGGGPPSAPVIGFAAA